MKTYQVIIYQESLASAFLGAGKVNPVKFAAFLNEHARDGWEVKALEREIRRTLLILRREAMVVIMEKDA